VLANIKCLARPHCSMKGYLTHQRYDLFRMQIGPIRFTNTYEVCFTSYRALTGLCASSASKPAGWSGLMHRAALCCDVLRTRNYRKLCWTTCRVFRQTVVHPLNLLSRLCGEHALSTSHYVSDNLCLFV
jgi:hypothetical protein